VQFVAGARIMGYRYKIPGKNGRQQIGLLWQYFDWLKDKNQ